MARLGPRVSAAASMDFGRPTLEQWFRQPADGTIDSRKTRHRQQSTFRKLYTTLKHLATGGWHRWPAHPRMHRFSDSAESAPVLHAAGNESGERSGVSPPVHRFFVPAC